jgi:anti-anti-sigma factor
MLRVKISQTAGRTELRFAGMIDHTSADEFARVFAELQPTIVLDLHDVTSISSYGVGLLIRYLSPASKHHKIEFARCSETMIDQFQMLQFRAYGRITSFRARYACPRCARTDSMLLEVDLLTVDRTARTVDAPSYPCACGDRFVVDDSLEFVIEHKS